MFLAHFIGDACPRQPHEPAPRRFPLLWSVEESDACFVVTGRRREACTSMAPAASIKLKAG
jgi:hypothetical protein